MFAAPTMVKRLVQAAKASGGKRRTGLRTIVYGGGPMYLADIVEAVEHFGPIFVQIYGQGESPMAITALSRARGGRPRATRAGARGWDRWGVAQSVVEVMIGDEGGEAGSDPTSRERSWCGATHVMPGYWQNPTGHRGKTLKRRLADDRRCRLDGCRWLCHLARPHPRT